MRDKKSAPAEKPNPDFTKANGMNKTAVATKPLKMVNTVATGPNKATCS